MPRPDMSRLLYQARSGSIPQAFGGGKRAQEEALAYQRSRCWHATQSIRTLGGLCMASHAEDRLGTAQLAQPNLGERPARRPSSAVPGLKPPPPLLVHLHVLT